MRSGSPLAICLLTVLLLLADAAVASLGHIEGDILERRRQAVGGRLQVDTLIKPRAPELPLVVRRETFADARPGARVVARETWCADRLVVAFDADRVMGKPKLHDALLKEGLVPLRAYPFSPVRVYRLPEAGLDAADRWLARLRKAVAGQGSIAKDYLLTPAETVPNDPRFADQWAPDFMNAPAAWDLATGTGDAIVAVIDTGLYPFHEDFYNGAASNLWTNPGEVEDGLDNDGNGLVDDIAGWDFSNNTGTAMVDTNGHGTKVAGVVGAAGDNARGIAGVAWRVRILPIRAGVDGFPVSTLAQAMDYVTSLRRSGHPVVAVNNSYGYKSSESPAAWSSGNALGQAIERARKQDILVTAASGNDGQDNDAPYTQHFYPSDALHHNLISVAAIQQTGTLWSGSNYGVQSVDLAAPGASILTTTNTGGYSFNSGTSFATPQVSGSAALLWAVQPGIGYAWMRELILGTVQASAALSGKVASSGSLDLGRLTALGALDLEEAWKRLHWDEAELAAMTFDWDADSDRDGWSEIEELAFGGDPRQLDAVPVQLGEVISVSPAEPGTDSLDLVIRFTWSPLADGLVSRSYEVYSNAIGAWQALAPGSESVLAEDFTTGRKTMEAFFTLLENPALIRVRVEPL